MPNYYPQSQITVIGNDTYATIPPMPGEADQVYVIRKNGEWIGRFLTWKNADEYLKRKAGSSSCEVCGHDATHGKICPVTVNGYGDTCGCNHKDYPIKK